jgi:AcrR family transcriptional regulator
MAEPTRFRLIAAALRLFAAKGFKRTTVGEIEQAAGFTARGGTLYKHFASKRALLEAAIDQQVHDVTASREVVELLPVGDIQADCRLVIRYLLAELQNERHLTALIEKEGDTVAEVRDRFYRELVEPGFRLAAQLLDDRLPVRVRAQLDVEALAVVLVGSVVNYRRNDWTFGTTLLDVDENRLTETLVALVASTIERNDDS